MGEQGFIDEQMLRRGMAPFTKHMLSRARHSGRVLQAIWISQTDTSGSPRDARKKTGIRGRGGRNVISTDEELKKALLYLDVYCELAEGFEECMRFEARAGGGRAQAGLVGF